MFFSHQNLDTITPLELGERQCRGEDVFLLDVRTQQENAAEAIEGSYLIPVQELSLRLHELPRDREIIAYCRVGNRSAYACAYLARLGYRVRNLEGGIVHWNTAMQPSARV